ncbi:Vacuolar protein sorting-associated protein 32 homolog 1 [Striga hermonthica]|uniref:Vacuolar protein sorting-associated protein 32 homolog 1 n=1 Tax=Striga hermonthica TaxID=68872 RepID=A0A9N7MI05_STRHE|nr:Vacuolar protein sorting-associated protein 32 homolog 1 [Striga hermonthica]
MSSILNRLAISKRNENLIPNTLASGIPTLAPNLDQLLLYASNSFSHHRLHQKPRHKTNHPREVFDFFIGWNLQGFRLCFPFETLRPTMFTRIFGKPKQETNALATLDKLNETLEMLEKKEKVLLKKAASEVEKAKEFTKAKNKRAAIQCLKRKRLYEQQIEQLGNFQLRIHDQMIMLEGAKATTETVDALRTGAAAMKAMQKATNIDDVDKTMDEINEQTENMKQIQEALSAPIGASADFDEDELEAELEELEGAELEEQLLQPATTAPAAPVRVPAGRQPANKVEDEDDELAELQREMAL